MLIGLALGLEPRGLHPRGGGGRGGPVEAPGGPGQTPEVSRSFSKFLEVSRSFSKFLEVLGLRGLLGQRCFLLVRRVRVEVVTAVATRIGTLKVWAKTATPKT